MGKTMNTQFIEENIQMILKCIKRYSTSHVVREMQICFKKYAVNLTI